jgi:hypothetical protein
MNPFKSFTRSQPWITPDYLQLQIIGDSPRFSMAHIFFINISVKNRCQKISKKEKVYPAAKKLLENAPQGRIGDCPQFFMSPIFLILFRNVEC